MIVSIDRYAGAFGFSWKEKIAKNIGFPVSALNASYYGKIVETILKNFSAIAKTAESEAAAISETAAKLSQSEKTVSDTVNEYKKMKNIGTVLPVNPYTDPYKGLKGSAVLIAGAAAIIGALLILRELKR
jgi:hypothetical protein